MVEFLVKIGQALLFKFLSHDVLDRLVKIAQIIQGTVTPAVAIIIGLITWRIQRQQAKTQQLQYRYTVVERRMKVFDATLEFIALVLRDARIPTLEPLIKLLRETREHHLLFGPEIGKYIDEIYGKGVRLHTIHVASQPTNTMRPQDIPVHTEIVEWFSRQSRIAEQMFLKYMDFREP